MKTWLFDAWNPKAKDGSVGVVLLFCLLLGFTYGTLIEPKWLVSTLLGQLMSGSTTCRSDSTLYLLHGATYTLIAQLPALMIKWGLSSWVANLLCSGLYTALAFAAVGVTTLVIARMRLMALLMPLAFLDVRLMPDHFYVVSYPVNESIFGIVAMFWALLTVALLSAGWRTTALFMAGMAPAIHPTWGVATWLLCGIALKVQREPLLQRSLGIPLAAGLLVFLSSITVHFLYVHPPALGVDAEQLQQLAQQWVQQHGRTGHNQLIGDAANPWLTGLHFFLPELTLAMLAWLAMRHKDTTLLQGAGRTLLFTMLIFTALLVGVRTLHELFAQQVPVFLDMLLYNRWLNLNTILNLILMVSLMVQLGWQRQNRSARFVLAFLTLLFIISAVYRNHLPLTPCVDCKIFGKSPGGSAAAEVLLALLYLAVLLTLKGVALPTDRWSWVAAPKVLLGVVVALFVGGSIYEFRPAQIFSEEAFHKRRHHVKNSCYDDLGAFKEKVAQGDGMMMIGPGALGRGSLNKMVLYATGKCQAAFPIMGHAYNPNSIWKAQQVGQQFGCAQAQGTPEEVQTCWQGRSQAQWQALATPLHYDRLLVDDRWQLDLPVVAEFCRMRLYEIPQ